MFIGMVCNDPQEKANLTYVVVVGLTASHKKESLLIVDGSEPIKSSMFIMTILYELDELDDSLTLMEIHHEQRPF